jgi:predicted amidophosphoribosyltransferase
MLAKLNSHRIEREKKVIKLMVELFCRRHHDSLNELCPDCRDLLNYAHRRLDKCKFGQAKPVCNKCPVHCYQKEMRERIRQVMRYAGPRMLYTHPLAALEHFYYGLRKS